MTSPEDSEFCQILEELMPHLPKANDAIRIIVKELKCGSLINWCNIRVVLCQMHRHNFNENLCEEHTHTQFSGYSRSQEKFENFIFKSLTLFDMHKCSDKAVIADVLELLCFIRNRYSMIYFELLMNFRLNQINEQARISAFEKTLFCSFKGTASLVLEYPKSSVIEPENWIDTLAIMGQVDILKLVIKYGATPIVPSQDSFRTNRLCGVVAQLYRNSNFNVSNGELRSFMNHYHQNVMILVKQSRKRLYLVSIVLRIINKTNWFAESSNYVQCARIFINSTPEPLITFEEIKLILTKLCSGKVPNGKVLQFLEKYEYIFPESHEASTPRTLKHLSRFQVRESLRTAKSFPYGVQSLGVPPKIQDYICLKDILL